MKVLRWLRIGLALVAVGLLVWRFQLARRPAPTSMPAIDYGRVADFSFIDQNGKPFGLKDLEGKVWVADFFFTSCMGPCPLLTTKMAQLQAEFSKNKDLMFVSFSVDPDYDKPDVLKKYAATYGAGDNWHFLTGPKEQTYPLIRGSFHLAVEPTPPGQKPSITDILHSLHFVLVDKRGRVLGYYITSDPEAMIALRQKLEEILK